jgi:hypothetical protein
LFRQGLAGVGEDLGHGLVTAPEAHKMSVIAQTDGRRISLMSDGELSTHVEQLGMHAAAEKVIHQFRRGRTDYGYCHVNSFPRSSTTRRSAVQ